MVENPGIEEQPSITTQVEGQPPTTAQIEECSWCPASKAPESGGQPAGSQTDLMDRLQTITGGTAFADVSEDQLLSDIGAVCEAWTGDTSLAEATSGVSLARAKLLEASESGPGRAAYTQFLETSANQRCLRDPTL